MSKKPRRTVEEAEAEIRNLRQGHISLSISNAVIVLIKYGSLVLCIRYLYLSVDSLSGAKTAADFGLKVLGNVSISQGASWLLAGGGAAYGINERRLRKDSTQKMAQRNTDLESKIDSGRTSSKLTRRGDTRPEDK